MPINNIKIILAKGRLTSGLFCIVLVLFLGVQNRAFACQNNELNPGTPISQKLKSVLQKAEEKLKHHPKAEKLVLTGLVVTLGAFGVHRLYLGTKEHIPYVYTLTLGGGFYIVPLVDLVLILSAKDLDKYKNNPHFIMWNGIDEAPNQE